MDAWKNRKIYIIIDKGRVKLVAWESTEIILKFIVDLS